MKNNPRLYSILFLLFYCHNNIHQCSPDSILGTGKMFLHMQRKTSERERISWTELPERTLIQRAGMRASYMQSRASRRFSLMMMVPSMASLRSVKVLRTSTMTRCIRSISWRRKMFMGCRGPIFFRRSLTCWRFNESNVMRKKREKRKAKFIGVGTRGVATTMRSVKASSLLRKLLISSVRCKYRASIAVTVEHQ